MPPWAPPKDKVGDNESVGRRLFDEPKLIGAGGQPDFKGLLLSHFEEGRDDEYSLDRLGQTSVDRRVVNYLTQRATAHGRTFKKQKSFGGWATIKARSLANSPRPPRLPPTPSPIDDPSPADNMYHAHVLKPSGMEPHLMALHLRYLFESFGDVHAVRDLENPGVLTQLSQMFGQLWKRARETCKRLLT
jgi:hypothetical protein